MTESSNPLFSFFAYLVDRESEGEWFFGKWEIWGQFQQWMESESRPTRAPYDCESALLTAIASTIGFSVIHSNGTVVKVVEKRVNGEAGVGTVAINQVQF